MAQQSEFIDEHFTYAVDLTATAGQVIPNVSIPLDQDAPFYARGLVGDGRDDAGDPYTNFSI